MTESEFIEKIQAFMENEARSCSMDFGGVTPEYVYRMWGGAVAIEDIATTMEEVRRKMYDVRRLRKNDDVNVNHNHMHGVQIEN